MSVKCLRFIKTRDSHHTQHNRGHHFSHQLFKSKSQIDLGASFVNFSSEVSTKSVFQKMNERVTHETKNSVRSGIRTHASRRRLRPERSALDHSAILTHVKHTLHH